MTTSTEFRGKNYSIEIVDGQFILVHPVSENETFDSFEELVEAHPLCEESRSFFFGEPRRDESMTEISTVCGNIVEYDSSGVGHNWRTVAREDIPSQIVEELEGEMLDGGMESCDDYVASNGLHYRWR